MNYTKHNFHLCSLFEILAHDFRALPGLSSLLALPKSKQKASAKSFGDPQSACRLKVTNGLSPRPFPRRLLRVGAPPAELMRVC
ncbi:hypothetical protein [uncultured Dysgonomonas sp.]|uniref:Uncharacterized protein n=1 Tax=uncultured Dysgonomonas sp. TaxID=206096 RepID=A0A212JR27_9BACT|nr:hypothetical protein [uncultured Dysgonomonas sp.]SBW01880.1 conserved hypothetical protein [uncultured Dysgonomonas sp.]